MDTERTAFLIIGVVIVAVIGQLLVRGGKRYLSPQSSAATQGERVSAGSAAVLVSVLFYLLTLGVVALLTVVGFGGSPSTQFLIRLGIFLVVLAVIFGVTLSVLNRRRQEELATEVETGVLRSEPDATKAGLRVEPVVETEARDERARLNTPMDPSGTAMGPPYPDHSL
ncbi:MAG TPA: hypothetical protein VHW44_30260 [Pseudonocardiaceae bacterium]|nr:hypothetical protein [Pseudonocardiaceae bacterium]